ncbi:1-Cys peroxiredoxin, partial [Rhodobacter sp. JA431]
RAMLYYPMVTGRQIDEILRLLIALQTAQEHQCAMPENWRSGDAVIVPTPATPEAAEARASEGYNTVDWYFSTRAL